MKLMSKDDIMITYVQISNKLFDVALEIDTSFHDDISEQDMNLIELRAKREILETIMGYTDEDVDPELHEAINSVTEDQCSNDQYSKNMEK
jgi:hypothetical protein